MRIDTTQIKNWGRATKTKPIKAKLFKKVFNDDSVIKHFLLKTLEGNAEIDKYNYLCMGEAGDVWQQSYDTLQKKYEFNGYDVDMWEVYNPLPDNEVNCVQISRKFLSSNYSCLLPPFSEEMYKSWAFYIIGNWGEELAGLKNIQFGDDSDYICQNQTDSTDVWIVKRKIFENTYEIVEKEEDWEISSIYKNPDGN